MPTEQGYSNQKKKGQSQFKTIHGVGSDSFGTISIPKYLSDISLTDQTIVSVSDVIGKDGQVQYWSIEITAHGAVAGNVIRIVDGSLKNFEFEVISVPDVDHVLVLPISSDKPLLTDLARVMGWVTGKADDEGNLVISQGPVQFKLDNVITEVSKDTAVPANTIALPVEDFEARAKLTLLEAKDFATETTLSSLEAKDFATETTLASLEAKDFATQTTLNSLLSKTAGSLVPVSYDQVIQTYVGATTDLSTVVFKNAGTTVATLTFLYDGSNRLIDVTRS